MGRMLPVIACGWMCVCASGGSITGATLTGAGGVIPDFNVTTPGVFTSSVTVTTGAVVTGVSFLGLQHTWCGDLSMTLTGPAGQSMTFFYRPGQTTKSSVAQNADFLAGNSYGFTDGGSAWPTVAGASAVLPSGVYAPVRSAFSPGGGVFGDIIAALPGDVVTLTIRDHTAQDTGSLEGWTLHYIPFPAPGGVALFGAACVFGARRRR